MYKKWCKVIIKRKLSSITTILAITITIAVITLFGQLIANLFVSYKDITSKSNNYDWGYSGLTSDEAEKLRDAVQTKKVVVKGSVIENRIGTFTDQLGLEVEWLAVEGDIDSLFNSRCTEGRMPENSDEICITQTYLDKTGLPIQVGDEIHCTIWTDKDSKIEKNATVVGIITRYTSLSSNYCVLSKPDKNVSADSSRSFSYYFHILDNTTGLEEEFIETVTKLTYLLIGSVDYDALKSQGINLISTNTGEAQDMTKQQSEYVLIPSLLFLSLSFIVTAVVFVRLMVGVMLTLRKRDYGTLFALGLSRKGMKRVLAFEAALFIACSAFPGILLSFAFLKIAYSILEKISITGYVSQNWSWLAVICSLILVTCGIALSYGLLYAKISKRQPAEYLSQSTDETAAIEKKKVKKIKNGYLFFVKSNLQRNLMRSFGIVLVLLISSLMIMVAMDVFSTLSVDNVEHLVEEVGELSSDYSIKADTARNHFFPNEMIDKIEKYEEIDALYPVYNASVKLNEMPCNVSIYDDVQLKGANLPVQDTPVLYAKDLSHLLEGGTDLYSFKPDETVVLSTNEGEYINQVSISGLASFNVFYDEAWPGYNRLICNKAFADMYLPNVQRVCSTILVKTDLSYMAILQKMEADNLWLNGYEMSFREYGIASVMDTLNAVLTVTGLLGACLLTFIFMSIMNITHQVSLLRNKEYSIMQAVGYRKKDIRNIACIEMTALSALAAVISILCTYFIHYSAFRGVSGTFPWLWCAVYSLILITLTWTSCQMINNSVLKKSIYERLCEVE